MNTSENLMYQTDNIDKIYLSLCSLVIISLLFVASKRVS
uniref:Uncharacterized protein n=1 Tax=viral metagenome TaxID=1070528 RepID=A0A6C0EVJ9_9ZZZZ